jgi:arabinose-5-phosphate isomerase
MDDIDVIEEAKNILKKEKAAICNLSSKLGEDFKEAVKLINNCKNKIVVMGIGKSGIVAHKIASTLSTIGIPAIFLHPAEALHGELGVVSKEDLIIIISNSGKTYEILSILPLLRNNKILAITSDNNSELAKYADLVLNTYTDKVEIIPTISTITALALADALIECIIKLRKISINEVFMYHPQGSIGRGLSLKVKDVMHINEAVPRVYPDTLMKDVLFEMTSKRLGMTAVVEEQTQKLLGIITDGDLRRLIEKKQNQNIWYIPAKEVMTRNPKLISKETPIVEALEKMKYFKITSLLIVNSSHQLIGVVHMHDILSKI